MTPFAVGFPSIGTTGPSTEQIFGMSNGFQMRWVDTVSGFADVMDFVSSRNWTNEFFKEQSMNSHVSPATVRSSPPCKAIPVWLKPPSPEPAVISDFHFGGNSDWKHGFSLTVTRKKAMLYR